MFRPLQEHELTWKEKWRRSGRSILEDTSISEDDVFTSLWKSVDRVSHNTSPPSAAPCTFPIRPHASISKKGGMN